ncbi:MAG: hypothetical protein ACR2PZ_13785 [Pseudomonadales bacterium]
MLTSARQRRPVFTPEPTADCGSRLALHPLLLGLLLLLGGLGHAEQAATQADDADSQTALEQVAETLAEVLPESADEDPLAPETMTAPNDTASTIATLRALIAVRDELRANIRSLGEQATAAQTASEKQGLLDQIEKQTTNLNATLGNLQEVAAGANPASLREVAQSKFNFQEELFALMEPAIKEMKDMTSHVRQKTEQRDKIEYFSSRVPVTESAIENLEGLLAESEDPALLETLTDMLANWRQQDSILRAELQAAQLQLNKLEQSEESLAEASQSYLKSFFSNRGQYLGQALLAVLVILALSRLIYRAMQRLIAGYKKEQRSFPIRLLDLSHRIITGLLLIIGPMVVFYLAEDWLLFSIGILLLLGIALGLRHAIPRYWSQVQLFLNLGAVREGERLELNGLPWLVRQINFYTMLENPTAHLVHRVKIDDLVDLRSRPLQKHEPWFPCRMGDWVILSNGARGRVVGLSQELVELVERGGAHRTYPTGDFLQNQPVNLSVNFRLKETIGISYGLQTEAVSTVPELLRSHIEQRLTDEGYGDRLLNLRVEFQEANTSSLDLVVIADFKGELADLYNRLRRSIQRYCVEACTKHGWEIPFTQVTLHQPS